MKLIMMKKVMKIIYLKKFRKKSNEDNNLDEKVKNYSTVNYKKKNA